MNNLNGLLKHPVLGTLPYNVLKYGNAEEIRVELLKLEISSYRSAVTFIGLAIVFSLFSMYAIWSGIWPSTYVGGWFTNVILCAIGVKSLITFIVFDNFKLIWMRHLLDILMARCVTGPDGVLPLAERNTDVT